MENFHSLEPRQRYFCCEYIKDLVISRAARRCNISPSTASQWLQRDDVKEAIQELCREREQRSQIDAEWVLTQLAQLFQADLADLYDYDTGDLLPVYEWPDVWRRITTAVEMDNRGSGENTYTVKKVRILDRLKVLELLGKHVNVKAFSDKLEISTDKDLTQRLIEGRRRAKQAAEELSFM